MCCVLFCVKDDDDDVFVVVLRTDDELVICICHTMYTITYCDSRIVYCITLR